MLFEAVANSCFLRGRVLDWGPVRADGVLRFLEMGGQNLPILFGSSMGLVQRRNHRMVSLVGDGLIRTPQMTSIVELFRRLVSPHHS